MFRLRHGAKNSTRGGVWTLPNGLTLCRILLVPVFLVSYLTGRQALAVACFCIAAGTDLIDGLVARLLDQRTVLGAVLDPLADKLLALAALVALTVRGPFSIGFLALALLRDLAVVGVAGVGWLRDRVVDVVPTRVSKYATFFICGAILLALTDEIALFAPKGRLEGILTATTLVAGECLLVATVQYLVRALKGGISKKVVDTSPPGW